MSDPLPQVESVVYDVQVAMLLERLERIEATLELLVGQRAVKDWYSTDEVAGLLGKARSPSASGAASGGCGPGSVRVAGVCRPSGRSLTRN